MSLATGHVIGRLVLLQMCSLPDQSLGPNVVIVQVGKDVGDDAAFVFAPLNHGGV